MKQIVIISGKGGTGKTILTASFAALARDKVLVDCDVDASDLHLLLHPEIKGKFEFKGGKIAIIDREKCNNCGKCIQICRFGAIYFDQYQTSGIKNQIEIAPISCEGCGICSLVCPTNAIQMIQKIAGEWYISETKYGPMVHAKLGIAEENSGKLVARIRQSAKEIAERDRLDYIIIDGPPGIGCPVIASLTGVDLSIVLTEPTLSGIHDMKRIIEVANHFSIPVQVIINKYDINSENSKTIESFCKRNRISVLGKLPFSDKVIESMINGIPVVEYCSDRITSEIMNIWEIVIASFMR